MKLSRILLLGVLSTGLLTSCSFNKEKKDEAVASQDVGIEQCLMNTGYSKIKMTKVTSGHLVVEGELNGTMGRFILDTGSGVTLIENKKTDKFGLTTENTNKKGAGAGGTNLQMQKSTGNKFVFGDLALDDFEILIMNIDHVNQAFKSLGLEEVDGIIGADLLTSRNGIIDYSNMFLYLVDE